MDILIQFGGDGHDAAGACPCLSGRHGGLGRVRLRNLISPSRSARDQHRLTQHSDAGYGQI
jgi:hypothetical protein